MRVPLKATSNAPIFGGTSAMFGLLLCGSGRTASGTLVLVAWVAPMEGRCGRTGVG